MWSKYISLHKGNISELNRDSEFKFGKQQTWFEFKEDIYTKGGTRTNDGWIF